MFDYIILVPNKLANLRGIVGAKQLSSGFRNLTWETRIQFG